MRIELIVSFYPNLNDSDGRALNPSIEKVLMKYCRDQYHFCWISTQIMKKVLCSEIECFCFSFCLFFRQNNMERRVVKSSQLFVETFNPPHQSITTHH